jgi:hypothetical protein
LVDGTLERYDWTIDLEIPSRSDRARNADDATSPDATSAEPTPASRREYWLALIREITPSTVVSAQESAVRSQQEAEERLSREGSAAALAVLELQHKATEAQEAAVIAGTERLIEADQQLPGGSAAGTFHSIPELAAVEAAEILEHVAPTDRELARITFQYPIFDRQTQTFGTVHYEPDMHHTIIRLKNEQSEKLKAATQRLVEDLIIAGREVSRSVRALNAIRAAGRFLLRAWFRPAHRQRRQIAFGRIRVLEPRSANEAFSGEVVSERSLESVIRERRGDLIVAAVFLSLGVVVFLLSSPLVWNFDYKTHTQQWSDGWLPWIAGNLSRVGSAFFVGVFLPIIQIWLYWRNVRRKPSIEWHIDVAQP